MDWLGVRRLPYLARRNYYYEFVHLVPWGLLAGIVEGQITAVVVAKTFDAGEFLIATASAMPIASLLLNVVWGMLCVGRPKLRLATIFGLGTALCTLSVGVTPHTQTGGVLFVVQMGLAQVFLSGVVTVRSALWKHNYPPELRGRIVARLQSLRMFMSVGMLAAAAAIFDVEPGSYRWVYPMAAGAGFVGLVILQKIHVRRERPELRAIQAGQVFDAQHRALRRYDMEAILSPRRVIGETFRVLRQDREFARFMSAQMFFGFGVQMVDPVLVVVVREAFDLYWMSTVLIVMLPKLVIFGSLRRWGVLYDRVPLPRFRVYVGLCAAGGLLFGMIGDMLVTLDAGLIRLVLPLAFLAFTVRAVMQGLHQGGGSLAWTLGHLHFSDRHDAELYMGVHVTLAGMRGLIAPFIGVALLGLIGWGVWAVALAVCLVGVAGFHAIDRDWRRTQGTES